MRARACAPWRRCEDGRGLGIIGKTHSRLRAAHEPFRAASPAARSGRLRPRHPHLRSRPPGDAHPSGRRRGGGEARERGRSGAGAEALSAAALARCPDCRVELIDAEMLEQARTRLAGFAARATWFQGPLPPCDATVASPALHHVPTLTGKRTIFAATFDALAPGGVVVNADVAMPAEGRARHADRAFGRRISNPAASPRRGLGGISRSGPTKTHACPSKTRSPRSALNPAACGAARRLPRCGTPNRPARDAPAALRRRARIEYHAAMGALGGRHV